MTAITQLRPLTIIASVVGLLAAGCAAPSADPMTPVADTLQERTGHRIVWAAGSKEDADAARAVSDLLTRPLSADAAVQVALLNNPAVRAAYEEVGIAQAELVQAGLLRNPIFEAEIKFAEAGGGTGLELTVAQSFIDVLLIPLRQKVAAANLTAAQQRVIAEVLETAAETRSAWYEAVAAAQTLDTRRTILQAAEASALLSRRLNEAGNIPDLDYLQEQALYEQAKLEVSRAEVEVVAARESLNKQMGVYGEQTAWTTPQRLPDPPADALAAQGLETLAVQNRADLRAAVAAVGGTAAAAGVPIPLLWLDDSEVGMTAERDTDGDWELGPIIALPIPLFDTGQAALSGRRAEFRQARARLNALAVEIRADVRTAVARRTEAWRRALFYRDTLLPLRAKVLQQTQLQYNAMHTGLIQLLMAKQEQIRTGIEYVEALRDFWTAHAELEQAVGGKLPE